MTAYPQRPVTPADPDQPPDADRPLSAGPRAFNGPTEVAIAQAATLFEQLELEQAVATLLPVLKTDPGAREGWILLARLRLALDEAEGALDAADHAIQLDAGEPRPLALSSRALTVLGRHEDAVTMAYRAVIADPRNALWHDRVAWALLAADRHYADAEQAARTAIGLDPTEAHYYYTHGVTLESLGHTDQARQALLTSLRMEPENPVAQHHLAVLNGEAAPAPEARKRGWKLFGRKS
ncbi:tetratricopeptide repeat protein [Actinoplanes bogorensis]|uniref:Tetratricopeptide repeat protein n=1 Tax=Paractinoplanes bogorensis TaxID=1610840 RepID=A0ABS5YVR0_9ACTN|nr:tetratricopeptide repeat protein [Actinoplanes bogorensis]MBU2667527.1 tetratricopeptide repeat protein [Actinoplanes bogorensis]